MKLLINILLTIMLSCNSSQKNNDAKNYTELVQEEVCQAFVKAICTKDTITFYKLVDKENLTMSMNDWIKNEKKIKEDDLFFIFFFVYSPLKIGYQDLINERNKNKFFADFKIESKETIDQSNVKLNLAWKQNIADAEIRKIEVDLRKIDSWKIIGARWKTLF